MTPEDLEMLAREFYEFRGEVRTNMVSLRRDIDILAETARNGKRNGRMGIAGGTVGAIAALLELFFHALK
jgi:hypothetical protein